MTSQSSVGKELVENFQLLLQFLPNDDCASVVNESMLSLPDKRSFQSVMKLVLDIMKPEWRSEITDRFFLPQDERLFNNMLCDHIKMLRKEFPEVGLPVLTPSSLICFHGHRCRETLLKIAKSLMLFIMKKEGYQPDEEMDREILKEYTDLSEECDNLSKQIQQKKEENDKAISHQKEVLKLVVSSGYWNEDTKRRLLDISDKNIITEMLKKKENSFNELKSLKEELKPYFTHVYHKYNKIDCTCQPVFNLSDEKLSKISDLLCEVDRNHIRVDIMLLKLISAVKRLKINFAKSVDPNVQIDEHVPTALIDQLEDLVSVDLDENTSVDVPELLGSSPLAVDMNSPKGDSSHGFTPITQVTPIAHDWTKIMKRSVKMDLESLANGIIPAKVCTSPVYPVPSRIVSSQFENPRPNETIMSVVERMRCGISETPNKFGKPRFNSFDLTTAFPSQCISTGPLLHDTLSTKKSDKLTPASKSQIQILSQTTGRRQSMGFMKPTSCLVRRQLSCTSLPKVPPSTSSEGPKSTVEAQDVDKILDKIVEQLVEGENNESFCSDSVIGDLDLSLSGVEPIKAPCAENELQLQANKNDKFCLSVTRAEQTVPLMEEHSILSEVIEDDKEISAFINSICEEECPNSQDLDDKTQDMFLCDKEISKIFDSQQKLPRETEVAKKRGRPSLDLLIERFNAIKMAQQKK